ncbi:MAG: methyltransferase domain-containing protein [Armatimonadota bacterium]|nr:methyltransferase domain-containing protein [Armatimonadota bacterium]MDR7455865.1 methyltransferase domain-containing protein [Armatimonadota bacterium]
MRGRREWWRDVFDRPTFLKLYERADVERAATQVEQVVRLLDLHPPARVLDLCSGYGRHSVELARRGFDVVGVDISEMQVRRAAARAAAAGSAAAFVVGDARALPVAGPFDAAINMFLSFGYFATDAENQAMLAEVARVLRRGGRLLIDFWNREQEIRNFQPVVLDRRDDDILEIEDWTFDPLAGRLNWVNTVIFPDGRREAWTHSIRAYTVAEVRAMLDAAGFALAALYGGLDGAPYTLDAEAAVFVAERL